MRIQKENEELARQKQSVISDEEALKKFSMPFSGRHGNIKIEDTHYNHFIRPSEFDDV